MPGRFVQSFYLEELGNLLFDSDINDRDVDWGPNMLSAPPKTVDEMKRMSLHLQTCHHNKDPYWHDVRFDLLQDVRIELVNWHRRITLDGVGENHANIVSWDAFHESGLADGIVEMAADEEIYVMDGGILEEYLHNIYSALCACVCAYFRCLKLLRERYLKQAKLFLEKVNRLYMKLWSRREQTLDKLSDTPMHGHSMHWRIIYLARVADQIYLDCYCHIRKLTYGRTHHVTLYIWTRTRQNIHVSYAAWWYFSDALAPETPIKTGPTDNAIIRQFIEEAILHVNQQGAFIATVSFMLTKKLIVDEKIIRLLDTLYALNCVSPRLLQNLPSDIYAELRNSCSIACQRQLCLGGEEIVEPVYDIFAMSFHWFAMTKEDVIHCIVRRELSSEMATDILEEFLRIKLLQLVERFVHFSTIPTHIKNTFIPDVFWSVGVCRDALNVKGQEQASSEHSAQVVQEMKSTVRSVWHSVSRALHRHAVKPSVIQGQWKSSVKLWGELGQLCGISSSDTDLPRSLPQKRVHSCGIANSPSSKEGCSWNECLCTHTPSHGMKVCKGCWRALYCSSKCQARDWRDGHREICRGPIIR
ncbi:hypothetical protein BDY19DRAFT_724983 [Irpex rosettiformis]|uniref:Uncharacterized protein n=1 Tax=Irpex rosettiformis TaxID=378272 RepID=A0ACB8U8T2_9APHY|nr:hypothetical protein BDY19DRAFT_724983 [Irpex rosettiformis]